MIAWTPVILRGTFLSVLSICHFPEATVSPVHRLSAGSWNLFLRLFKKFLLPGFGTTHLPCL